MRDDLRRGVGLMLTATMLFSCSDVLSKYTTEHVPTVQVACVRYAVFVLLAFTPHIRSFRRGSTVSRRPWLQLLRGLGVVGSAVFFVLALGHMAVAEATAINFVNPLLITVLAVPFLGERVSARGWLAVGAGFVGVLIVVRPGPAGLQPAALLVLGCSLSWSVAILVTRRLVAVDRSSVTVFWTACTGFVVCLLLLPWVVQPMTAVQWALCLTIGVVASGGQWLAVLAYKYAAASVLAPLSYLQLIWASVLGWLVFGRLPDRWVIVGGVIVALSGMAVIRIERARVGRTQVAASPPLTPLPAGAPSLDRP